MHYNYFRYYDPGTGRYLRADPIGLKGGLNLFTYASNNPLNLIDFLGLESLGERLGRQVQWQLKAGGIKTSNTFISTKDIAKDYFAVMKSFQGVFLCDPYQNMSLGEKIQSQIMWQVNAGGLNNLPEIAKSAAMIYGASEAVLWGYVASPIIINKILTDPQGSLDFVTSMFPGTSPAPNLFGLYGYATGDILDTERW